MHSTNKQSSKPLIKLIKQLKHFKNSINMSFFGSSDAGFTITYPGYILIADAKRDIKSIVVES